MSAQVSGTTRWSTERVERVRRLTAEGWNARQIGEQVGASRNAVASIWRRFGIKRVSTRNRWDEASVSRVARLLDDHCSYADVAAAFGVTVATITNVVGRHRLRPRQRKLRRFTMKAPDLDAEDSFDRGPFKAVFSEGFAGQTGRLDLIDLADDQCRFPIDQPDGSVRFCARPQRRGSAYCEHHHARCTDGPAIVFKRAGSAA